MLEVPYEKRGSEHTFLEKREQKLMNFVVVIGFIGTDELRSGRFIDRVLLKVCINQHLCADSMKCEVLKVPHDLSLIIQSVVMILHRFESRLFVTLPAQTVVYSSILNQCRSLNSIYLTEMIM